MFNRGGTVEFKLHPQCISIEDGAFFIEKNHRVFDSFWAIAKRMPARRGQEKNNGGLCMAKSLLAHLYTHIRGSQEDIATLSLH